MFSTKVSRSEFRAAGLVAEQVSIADVRLVELTAKQHHEPPESSPSIASKIKFGMRSFEILPSGMLRVIVGVSLEMIRREGGRVSDEDNGSEPLDTEPPEPYASISIACAVDYRMPSGPIPEHVEKECLPAFAKYNALHNGWPYLRQYLQSITSSMGMGAVVLPPLIIRSMDEEQENPQEKEED